MTRNLLHTVRILSFCYAFEVRVSRVLNRLMLNGYNQVYKIHYRIIDNITIPHLFVFIRYAYALEKNVSMNRPLIRFKKFRHTKKGSSKGIT